MKITESRLRKIIRDVIIENSHDMNYMNSEDDCENIINNIKNKITSSDDPKSQEEYNTLKEFFSNEIQKCQELNMSISEIKSDIDAKLPDLRDRESYPYKTFEDACFDMNPYYMEDI